MCNFATKKEPDHATDVDKSDLGAKKRSHCFERRSWQSRH